MSTFDPRKLLGEIEGKLEAEGYLVRVACAECGEELLVQSDDRSQAMCSECDAFLSFVADHLQELAKPVERAVAMGIRRRAFFLKPSDLWLMTPGKMTKLHHFDPTPFTDEKLVEKVKTQLIFL